MAWQILEARLSTPRMSRYLNCHDGEVDHAVEAYTHNMRLAESLVCIFHVLEVAVRNGIQKEMIIEYKRSDWYEEWADLDMPAFQELYRKIGEAKRDLVRRRRSFGHDDIVAELSFGFWTTLFNRSSITPISKPLMRVFHYCPSHRRRPDVIRSRLNAARTFRNRCFHHEPLLWNPLHALHEDILELIGWIDPALRRWTEQHDRFPSVLGDWMAWREKRSQAMGERPSVAHPRP